MPLNLTLKPAQVELIAKPNTTITQAYNIINNSDSSIIISTEVLPFAPLDIDGSVTYDNVVNNPNFSFSLANADLQLGQTFVLKPNENRQLVLKIKSTERTSLQDSYFTFFIKQLTDNRFNQETSTYTTARIGSHLLISTSTTENTQSDFSISNFTITPTIKDIFFGQIRINSTIKNNSPYFNKINGKLTITKNNLKITETDLFPHNVLANSSRQVYCLSNDAPVECVLSPPFWPGNYTATISLDTQKSSSINFYVFPYTLLIFLTLATATFFLSKKFFSKSKRTD